VLDPKVFKAYDVRGIYPTDIDEDGARAIGRAYVEQFEPKRIAVGRDMRVSSPTMAAAVIEGAAAAGAEVVDVGLVGTEMVYFAVGHLDLDGGIQVTASHNPKEYTGMKIVRRGAMPVGGDSGLLDIRDRAMSQADTPVPGTGPVRRDRCARKTSFRASSRRSLSFIDVEAVERKRVVIDAANGMAA
jgi:phosphomannomutase